MLTELDEIIADDQENHDKNLSENNRNEKGYQYIEDNCGNDQLRGIPRHYLIVQLFLIDLDHVNPIYFIVSLSSSGYGIAVVFYGSVQSGCQIVI